MAFKKIWDEEYQEWVYDDSDKQDDDGTTMLIGFERPEKTYSEDEIGKSCLPLHILQEMTNAETND